VCVVVKLQPLRRKGESNGANHLEKISRVEGGREEGEQKVRNGLGDKREKDVGKALRPLWPGRTP